MRTGAALAACLLLLTSPRGHTSGRQEHLTLAQLIAQSSLIVVAEPADTPSRVETVLLRPGPNAGPPAGRSKPVQRGLTRWTVREVLSGERAAPGDVLEVRRGNDSMWLEIAARAEFEQVNKIPIIPTYRSPRAAELVVLPDGGLPRERRRLLFLSWAGDGHELAAEGAVEALSARDEVLALVPPRRAPRPGPLPLTPPPPVKPGVPE